MYKARHITLIWTDYTIDGQVYTSYAQGKLHENHQAEGEVTDQRADSRRDGTYLWGRGRFMAGA